MCQWKQRVQWKQHYSGRTCVANPNLDTLQIWRGRRFSAKLWTLKSFLFHKFCVSWRMNTNRWKGNDNFVRCDKFLTPASRTENGQMRKQMDWQIHQPFSMTCISTISKKFVAVDFIVFDQISACGRTSTFMTCTCIPLLRWDLYKIFNLYLRGDARLWGGHQNDGVSKKIIKDPRSAAWDINEVSRKMTCHCHQKEMF